MSDPMQDAWLRAQPVGISSPSASSLITDTVKIIFKSRV